MLKILFSVIIGASIFVLGVRYIERNSIFFPMREIVSDPSSIGLEYQEIYFDTDDGKSIHAWFVPRPGAEFTVIFCHGNAGNLSHRLGKILIFHELGLNTFIFDYRGFGKSEGFPYEEGVYLDARAAYRHLTGQMGVPGENIILYGESIGGAVVIDLASDKPVAGVITENTFTSIKDMASIVYPFIPHFVFSSRFDSLAKIGDVHVPKLIIHSVDDEIVPFSLGQRLFEAAVPPKRFLKVKGGHNTAFMDSEKEFRKGISSFIDEIGTL